MNYVVEFEYSLSLFMENLQAGEPPSTKLIINLDPSYVQKRRIHEQKRAGAVFYGS